MAKFDQTVTASFGVRTWSSPEFTDQEFLKFLDWIWGTYHPFEADGVTPKPRNNANLAQAYDAFARKNWLGIRNNVKRWLETNAARDAVTNVPEPLPDP